MPYSRTSETTYRDVAARCARHLDHPATTESMSSAFSNARRGSSYFLTTRGDPARALTQAVNIPGFAYFGREPYSYIQRVEPTLPSSPTIFHGPLPSRYQVREWISTTFRTTATFTVNYGGVYDIRRRRGSIPAPVSPGLILSRLTVRACPATFISGNRNPQTRFQQAAGAFWAGLVAGPSELHFELWGSFTNIEFPPQFASPDTLL